MTEQEMYEVAHKAGQDAVADMVPIPMVIGNARNIFSNEIVPGTEQVILDGPCGFAWINIKPGNSRFAKWLVANGKARKDSYNGGVIVWVSDYRQSVQRKETYAMAFARSLRQNGIDKAYSGSRLD